ncbi:MAG: Pirin family protein [Pseudonocardia sp.]|nr:Pirin family protein [Pseudonocardia sp.]
MSGSVTTQDADPVSERSHPDAATVEITESRLAQVGPFQVRRALPRRKRRTVGAWCFVDHMGPADVERDRGVDIAPHPHIGLQTVTWLFAGEVVHRDSLGSEQLIRPGELNLMTSGLGVTHSEEGSGRYQGEMHGVQLWVAQPSDVRDGAGAFEHHAELPELDLDGAVATVLVGQLDAVASTARRDTDHLGVDLQLHGPATVPLRPEWEYALVVCTGAVLVDGQLVTPGHLAYLGLGRDECRLSPDGPTRALLLGGAPFDEPILMWWNFVARTRAEITAAYQEWSAGADRFGRVASKLPRIEVAPPPWLNAAD